MFRQSVLPSASTSRLAASATKRVAVPRTNRSHEDYRQQFGDVVDLPDKRILDVGAGDAGWHRALPPGSAPVVRVDIDYAMHPPDKNNAIAATAMSLPFESETFDYVVCSWTMPYVVSPVAALREMIRVVRTGGLVMVYPTFHVLTRFVHPCRFIYEKSFSASLGARPTLIVEKDASLSEADWDELAASVADAAKLRPSSAVLALRRRWHAVLISRMGVQMDHHAPGVTRRYLRRRIGDLHSS